MAQTNDTIALSRSALPSPELMSPLVGGALKGIGGIFQYASTKKQQEAASQMQRLTSQLGMIELLMERQRQEAGRAAMGEALLMIDEAYGEDSSPRAQRNRAIIQGMIAQLGRAAARPGAERSAEAGAGRALAGRQAVAGAGVGGSAAEAMARQLVGARAAEREAVSATREGAEYGVRFGLRRRRAEARKRATELMDVSGARVSSPYEAAMTSVFAESAARQEGLRHGPALVATGATAIADFVKDLYSAAHKAQAKDEQELLEAAQRRNVLTDLGFV